MQQVASSAQTGSLFEAQRQAAFARLDDGQRVEMTRVTITVAERPPVTGKLTAGWTWSIKGPGFEAQGGGDDATEAVTSLVTQLDWMGVPALAPFDGLLRAMAPADRLPVLREMRVETGFGLIEAQRDAWGYSVTGNLFESFAGTTTTQESALDAALTRMS